jgi:Ubiquitin-activating enzyme E1 FCCH domain
VSNNHIIPRHIGSLRGFSTDSIFIRPPNVADRAINIQRAPDDTLQLRRGYQCQIAEIGGMGNGTFDNPALNMVQTVTLGLDGFLYNKLTKQIYFYYDGQVTGVITGSSQSNPTQITSVAHGLQTGAIVILRNIGGMVQLNNKTYTITVTGVNTFTLNGIDSTAFSAYTSGGMWSIAFADQRYLTFTIFTDPRYLTTNPGWSIAPWSFSPWGSPSGASITCNITVNRAAQVASNQAPTNTVTVQFGHELVATDVIQFYNSLGQFQQRNIVSVTPTTITFDGFPAGFIDGVYINQFFDIPFRNGFDVVSPYLISTFIATITNPSTGIFGLNVAINGDSNYAAAFLQIIEPVIIDSNSVFTIDYWYWQQINFTINPPFPGSANLLYQNSPNMENASMVGINDVIFVANGWDFPQKYDGQTVYRAGMPMGIRPSAVDDTGTIIKPFTMNEVYQYAITYEQIDNRGNEVEGQISDIWQYDVMAATASSDVTVTNLQSTIGANWNTNTAQAIGGTATSYGPDVNGYYYDLVDVNPGYTLKVGDSAYYGDTTDAVMNTVQPSTITINVNVGHGVVPLDTVYFVDSTSHEIYRVVDSVTANTITIRGSPVSVDPTIPDSGTTSYKNILVYKTSLVFGDVGIVDGNQNNTNMILLKAGFTLQNVDLVDFIDASSRLQRRTITNVAGNIITVSGIPVSVTDLALISSENQRSGAITLQRLNANPATLATDSFISNNLRINIYRTLKNQIFGTNGNLYLVASIPNNGLGTALQVYNDEIADAELSGVLPFANPKPFPTPPPISKYLRGFGSQLFYAGGERGNPENSDFVFFSIANNPEVVPIATNFFSVPNVDDDITGIGVAGTTLVTTKNNSLWATTGNFITGQIDTIQIAPGTNIGCAAHATIASIGTLMYFLHTNGVYAITENQLYPTDAFGNPIPLSRPIDVLFRETPYLPQTRFQFQRAVGINYTKDNQYWLFLPCEDSQSTIRTANAFSQVLCYDYQEKNWFQWFNINAAGGMLVVEDDIYFQERRFSGVDGNTANFYKQHRFYRLVDHADHAGPQRCEWRSSWEDLGQPEVRKKFCRCILLMDRLSELYQLNNPQMYFSSYTDRIPNLQSTIALITQTDNIRNAPWSYSPWGWNIWSGYQDSFVTVNLKQGTVAKSIQVGFTIQGINMDIRLAGFQLEIIPENRKTVVR